MDKTKPEDEENSFTPKDKEIAELKKILDTKEALYRESLQQTRQYYEDILSLMPGHVYWLDRNNVYLGCNEIQAKQARLSSRQQIVGLRNADLPWKDQAEELDILNTMVMESGVSESKIEYATMANGDGIYFSQKVPLRNSQNEVIGVLGVSVDITELKRAEVELVLAKERAEEANRSKTAFIANMSHDIRTPLCGVVGMSKFLEESITDPEHKLYAKWINESGEQLLSLLTGILDVVSSESSGESCLYDEPFDLLLCIDEIMRLERPTTLLKGIELNVEIDNLVPQFVCCDRTKLHRVLLNLLGNSIKFTEKGHVTLQVKYLGTENDTIQLQFLVIDSGIGIPIEHQKEVFTRFFRGSSSYEGVYSGHGIGLHIAQSYVAMLGGELSFTSHPNQGTTFYFDIYVPAHSNDKISIAHPKKEQKNQINMPDRLIPPSADSPQLLLVEDNTIALRIVELIATKAGCHFTAVMDGIKALELATNHNYDLIITDVGLPGLSGSDLTHKIREWEKANQLSPIPIIGLTAHAQAEAKQACIDAGMNAVYLKPIQLDVMLAIIHRFCKKKSKIYEAEIAEPAEEPSKILPNLFKLDKQPLIDIKHAQTRLGSQNLLCEMLSLMAQQDIPHHITLLENAFSETNWDAIEKLAHKLKGGAMYCGTFKMQFACQYLERACKQGQKSLLEPLYTQLLSVMMETKKAILQVLTKELV